MPARRLVFLLVLAAAPALAAGPPPLAGAWDSPLGRVALEAKGDAWVGRLVKPAGPCRFRQGDEVLRATLLDDSLAGTLRVCVAGPKCQAGEAWGSVVLLATPGRLSGAVHVSEPGCAPPAGAKGGVMLVRPDAPTTTSAPSAAARRGRARELLRDGGAWLSEGNFERARQRFLDALAADPAMPEAMNGVGVTYRMRGDLPAALDWYKKAVAVDPDFGDAYYNMACLYALQGEKVLALRYLQIAALNGYATAEGMDEDPDLEAVRGEAAYRALVHARM
jgi:hypothetical protein